jgi:hypothetical protein
LFGHEWFLPTWTHAYAQADKRISSRDEKAVCHKDEWLYGKVTIRPRNKTYVPDSFLVPDLLHKEMQCEKQETGIALAV